MTFHLQATHSVVELTTGFHTLGVAHQLNGHVHHDRLVAEYLEEVQVQDGVRHGVELDVLQDGAVAASIFPVDLYEVDVWRVD